MKILITGATGFLGLHIAEELKKEGHEVVNFSRSHTKELDAIGVSTIQGDLSNVTDVQHALSQNFEAIFHVASKVGMWGKWEEFYRINFEGTKNLFDEAKNCGVKYFVHTSTPSVVFGKDAIEGANESLGYPKEYLSYYAKSKAMAEEYILNDNSPIKRCALRPHLIFGKRDQNIIPRLLEANKNSKLKIIGNGSNLVDVIHVTNATHAHLLAFEELQGDAKNNHKAYFIAQEKPVNLWSFINSILVHKGQQPVTKKVSINTAYAIGYLVELFLKTFKIFNIHPPMTRFVALQLGTSHYFSHDNAKRDFNYSPVVSIDEAIKDL
ncbi:NAD-dependent epimerase/dehydratase family protein [Bacteriovorax sp. Seq25_V]|uniref:NAD-dependent epimerase/dehydratase family protein n=1 Tax=Bacteriovorax sp. Seq25_V TaxID=1201288 RepID=UPI000389E2E5|nr:NAD-dependent epimerase/dehydratase family protein [Bacteriovorax sp. Seq25_V]EQC44877.1 3-beta hydroxysteroid dehydrogenase/isomerase family protein [Bacteriovorax sp. Seq25_V]